jgi:hypothetical protein
MAKSQQSAREQKEFEKVHISAVFMLIIRLTGQEELSLL